MNTSTEPPPPTTRDLRDLTRQELRDWMKDLDQPTYRGDQVFRWIWSRGAESLDEMTNLPLALRQRLAQESTIGTLTAVRVDRSEDGTRKILVGLADGREVECVLIPDGDRVTLCVSTQVGCALACAFCATGTMGFTRHLTPGEIAGQVALAEKELRARPEALTVRDERPITNLVYMGMGEPLHNYDGTLASLRILTDEQGHGYSPRRITVSTVGIIPKMLALGEEMAVTLAVSLHAGDDETRGRLMPVNKKYPLADLIQACREFPLRTRERITFEYTLLRGVNDRLEDADRLAKLLDGLKCKVNVIPFNEHPGARFERPDDEGIRAFDTLLRDRGVPTYVRRTRGRDIAAACGQLAVGDRGDGGDGGAGLPADLSEAPESSG